MYRLRVVPIYLPPLRERREDISVLAWHFIDQHNAKNRRKIEEIEPEAMRLLLDYSWRGNIRELQNVVEYAFAVGRGTVLKSVELPPEFHETPEPVIQNVPLSIKDEKSAIERALIETKNVNAAARSLGMSRATFWRKRKLYEI
jgi:transcriptional regulator with PAS, ATPase and Fis domain